MPNADDPFDLRRFVDAQARVYDDVRAELRSGRKRSHWMWFIFPQIAGLGHSPMAQRYAISSLQEAQAYLDHPILGPRLKECTQLMANVEGRSALEILGAPDDMKFRSCLTLFAHATQDNQIFLDTLRKYFDGAFDPMTIERL
jgi:uncharacterized protein (DUF1810 family)